MDKRNGQPKEKRPRRIRKVIQKPALVVLGTLATVVAYFYLEAIYFTAKQTEAKWNLSEVYAAQKDLRKKNEKQPQGIDQGFHPEGNLRYEIYQTADQVPEGVKKLIPKEHIPFISKEKFLALAWPKEERDPRTYWIIDEKKNLQSFDSLTPGKEAR
jgi:type II secretory pathway pseudopilin PulG